MARPSTTELRPILIPYAKEIVTSTFPTSTLDFSPESIRLVEKVLDRIHKEYKLAPYDEGYNGIALEFAAYIVEVIDQNYGPVDWRRDGPEFGRDSFPLHWRDCILFPYAWCQKRIFDGAGDNVWSKFCVCVLYVVEK